jgi:hypothetical protein
VPTCSPVSVLTERKGVQVFPYPEASDTGIDLIVHLPPDAHPGKLNPYLFAQVKGTTEVLDDERKAAAFARKHWKPTYANSASVRYHGFRIRAPGVPTPVTTRGSTFRDAPTSRRRWSAAAGPIRTFPIATVGQRSYHRGC